MRPNTPAHLVYKEPLVTGDIFRLSARFSPDGKPSVLTKDVGLILDRIMTTSGPMNVVVIGLNPREARAKTNDILVATPAQLVASGLSEPVLFRWHLSVLMDPSSREFSGEMLIGHLAPEFGPQLAAARKARADLREKRARYLATVRNAAAHRADRR